MIIPELAKRSVTTESVEEMEGPIGRLFISFAFIDQALDFLLMELFPVAMKRNIASKMPFHLGQKIDLIEKCTARMKELSEVRADLDALLKQVSEYSWVRNTLAHGALSHYRAEAPSAFVFAKLSYNKDKGAHLLKDEVIPIAAISQAAHLASEAIDPLHKMLERIQAVKFA